MDLPGLQVVGFEGVWGALIMRLGGQKPFCTKTEDDLRPAGGALLARVRASELLWTPSLKHQERQRPRGG